MVSKTRFLSGMACMKRAYLEVHSPDLAASPSAGALARMREGTEVGRLARKLFDGVLVDHPGGDVEKAAAETQRLISSGAGVLFEATFLTDDAVAKADVLERVTDGWHLIEVKSSKSVKAEHLVDVAFQRMVLGACGLNVVKASLLLVSEEFVSDDGPVNPARYFESQDVTAESAAVIPEVEAAFREVVSTIRAAAAPEVAPNVHCKRGDCPFIAHCFVGLGEFDATTLPRISRETVEHLHVVGARDIRALPSSTKLTARQSLITGVVQSGEPFVSPDLGGVLAALKYPLHFLDFEAMSSALPGIPGVRAHQAVPFQWSCHVVSAPGSGSTHHEFLHEQEGDPRTAFLETLWELINGAGTVLYYTAYEVSRLKDLAGSGFDLAELALAKIQKDGADLAKIVEQNVYLPEFRGSNSIKRVYPALVPSGGYGDLEIQDGELAAIEYKRMRSAATTPDEARRVAAQLRAYCERDTWAMVEVFDALKKLSEGAMHTD
jgi:predicted RecB family nuclease